MNLTESLNIKFNAELDNMSFLSKNLYNYANYLIRQEFIKNKKWLRYVDLNKLCKSNENYQALPAQTAQQVLKLLDTNWISFFKLVKLYAKKKVLNGRPKMPKYKGKMRGRNILVYPFQNLSVKDGYIRIPKTSYKFKIREDIRGKKIKQVRVIPKSTHYRVEVIYEVGAHELKKEIKKVIGIDLGVNNLATLTNNIGEIPIIVNGRPLKSINQFYNKKRSFLHSLLPKKRFSSHKIEELTFKRNKKIKDYLHKASRFIADYAYDNKIDTIIIGKNKEWKQGIKIGKRNNQNFVSIPFEKLISMIEYKALLLGIKVVTQEESYTSKCSALDLEELKKHSKYVGRRVKRGLFKCSRGFINSDVNGSLNIIRKVVDDVSFLRDQSIEGLVFSPFKICF